MTNIVLYSATGCPLCVKYRKLLDDRGLKFHEKNTTDHPALLDELTARGIRMVPTIFVGEKYVAGFRPTSLLEILPS
jgi:glutaredoxin